MKKQVLALLGITLLSAAMAQGAIYPLVNSDFESPDLTSGTVGGITGWSGSYLQTAVATDVSLSAIDGDQVAYNDSPDSENFIMYQDTTAIEADTVYNLIFYARPLVDSSLNCLGVKLTNHPSYGVFYNQANFNSSNYNAPGFGPFTSTNDFELTPGQWTKVTVGFTSSDFQTQVDAGDAIRIILHGHKVAIDGMKLLTGSTDYYISQSEGDDNNDGLTEQTAWKTFANLDGLNLGAGSTIRLKRGDTWANSNLNIAGKGTASEPITLTAYGEGPNPIITGANLTDAACITLENPSYFHVDSMDCRDAKVGLYLRYTGGNTDGTGAMFNNQGIKVSHCNFQNMDEKWSDSNGDISVDPPYELSWGAGIWVGGSIPAPPDGPWPSQTTTVVDGVDVSFCSFLECSTGFGNNWYFPGIYDARIKNLTLEDSFVTGCENGNFAIFSVDGGHAKRFDSLSGGTGFYSTGTTGGFIQDSKNFVIDDCEFAFNKRNSTGNDGGGFDFEGNTANCTFTNNVIHDNDGSFLLLRANDVNTNLVMDDNVFYNNCRNAKDSGQNNEIRYYDNPNSDGSFANNGIYVGSDVGLGVPAVYKNPTDTARDFTGTATCRTSTPYSVVSARATAWNFNSNGDTEGWGGFNDLTPTVSGGVLSGTSTGADPYMNGPATWVNTRENELLKVRMSVDAGTTAQVFFLRETDQTWDGDKSVSFPVVADGNMHTYLIDMSGCEFYKGVITNYRLDPTDVSGANISVDYITSATDPIIESITAVTNLSVDITYNELMHPNGGVMNPANYTISGTGTKTVNANPDSVTQIPTENGPVYRLTWNSGSMDNATATLEINNVQDARGNSIEAGSTVTFAPTDIPSMLAGWNDF